MFSIISKDIVYWPTTRLGHLLGISIPGPIFKGVSMQSMQ